MYEKATTSTQWMNVVVFFSSFVHFFHINVASLFSMIVTFSASPIYFSRLLHRICPSLSAAYAISLFYSINQRESWSRIGSHCDYMLCICGSYVLPALHTCGRIVVAPPSPIRCSRSEYSTKKWSYARVCVCVRACVWHWYSIRFDSFVHGFIDCHNTRLPYSICVP